ncbi:AAA family ATPase [Undibacterium sp. TC4M20W]|uniref:AAA family ATPase n=1 Tax=Undibacterium sp. TC4M20W TaxID=3413052 RepID=UPI003BF06422
MKIKSFRATNFRSFLDTGHITLKPINLLVGKNSIGKSSFARMWPIFNQGAKVQKRTPILWNGDLVDFGTFKNILSRHATDKQVIFDFLLEIEKKDLSPKNNTLRYGNRVHHLRDGEISFNITLISEETDSSRSRCNKLIISVASVSILYSFDASGQLIEAQCRDTTIKVTSQYSQENTIGFLAPSTEYFSKQNDVLVPAYSPMHTRLFYFLRRHLHQRLANERIHEICTKLNVVGDEIDLLSYCNALPYHYKTWKDFLYTIKLNETILQNFHTLVLLAASGSLIKDIDLSLRQHFSTVNYIRPIRATAQRYYRKQELAVDNIDPEGSNLAFLLVSLTKEKLVHLNKWLSETLDVNVILAGEDGEQGHVMVNLLDLTTGRLDNMADMGFGFSQVLPLAVQAWVSSSPHARIAGRVYHGNTILVWEQPELHLHPAMQRKLARLIAKTTKVDATRNITFIIETHSQSMINEIGDLIIEEKFDRNSIQLLLFEQRESFETKITQSSYDEDGQLTNWPYGFLSV